MRFYCDNGHNFIKTEKEIREAKQSFRYCWCGEKLHINQEDLKEVVNEDVINQINEHINKYAKEIGLDTLLDILKRSPNNKVKQLYIEQLNKRGFRIKDSE